MRSDPDLIRKASKDASIEEKDHVQADTCGNRFCSDRC